MTKKAIISHRTISRDKSLKKEGDDVKEVKITIKHRLPTGTIIEGENEQFLEMEKRGYRVKILHETDILDVGFYRIDITKDPPKVPNKLEINEKDIDNWIHYLIQLDGLRNKHWFSIIQDRDIEIIEPISRYGLLVSDKANDVKKLESLPFVKWIGPFKPAYKIDPKLLDMDGEIEYINFGVYSNADFNHVFKIIENRKGTILNKDRVRQKDSRNIISFNAKINAKELIDLAHMSEIRWINYQHPEVLLDERSAQIAAGDLNADPAPNTGPNIGYQNTLTNLGLNGKGITIAICDSGVDTHNDSTMHPDLTGRFDFFEQATTNFQGDLNGHGTHVAGIAAGNGASGDVDPGNFLLGLGVAPATNIGSLNAIGTGVFVPDDDKVSRVLSAGANVMNNSWSAGINVGYNAKCRDYDELVRDPDPNTATLEKLAIVFAAGNEGANLNTLTGPNEAKNLISVGNSLNFRPGECDIDDIRGLGGITCTGLISFSSRGPAAGNRICPHIVAPGTNIISARPQVDTDTTTPGIQRPRDAYTDTGGTVHNDHYSNTGTSMAAPHVSGFCALLIEWWRNRTNDQTPNQALLKALLINGAVDIAGGLTRRTDPVTGNPIPITNIPNNDQGWGRVNLENMLLQAPATDRGPKIFIDQRHAFTDNGQEYLIRVAPVDTNRAMRITLVWTDAPGAVNDATPLVNDLDLEVTELAVMPNNVYKGNEFSNGFSVTGGNFDDENNVECVYIENPSGIYEVRIIAASINNDARPPFDTTNPWQDFVLVIDNAEVPASSPVSVVPVLDRSGSMVSSGYEEITRLSTKQFVDSLSIDDRAALVSFGSTGDVEYPTGASPTLVTITGQPIRDAITTQVDAINFGGCTYMGKGLELASDLLQGETNSRAIVLFSDGYDNKGCQAGSTTRPSAMDIVSNMPDNMPVYSCAMGSTSDQELLEQIASETDGLYYYMPTIDDLYEIYNYIRGQVSSDSLIVNETGTASTKQIGAFVDDLATEATFSVAWTNKRLEYNPGTLMKNSISVKLRDPNGNLLNSNYCHIHRIVGDGYVIFKMLEPAPGKWFVEIETPQDEHTLFNVGGFVRSPITMNLFAKPIQIAKKPLNFTTHVLHGDDIITGYKARAQIIEPVYSKASLFTKYKDLLARLKFPLKIKEDKLPDDIIKIHTLRNSLIKDKKVDLFKIRAKPNVVSLRPIRKRDIVPDTYSVFSMRTRTDLLDKLRNSFIGQFPQTDKIGSYNIKVTAAGISPRTRSRFIRKKMVSVLVK